MLTIFYRKSETEKSEERYIAYEDVKSNKLFDNETEAENDNSLQTNKKQLTIQVFQNIPQIEG